jgi:hypothetical protein
VKGIEGLPNLNVITSRHDSGRADLTCPLVP